MSGWYFQCRRVSRQDGGHWPGGGRLSERGPQQVQWVVVGVAFPFAFAGEDAGDDFQARLVVVGEVDLAKVPAGQASFEGGVGDSFGGQQASMEQFGGEQVQAVGEGVDLGNDIEDAAVVESIPAAEELR
jgi:hypothetical protein